MFSLTFYQNVCNFGTHIFELVCFGEKYLRQIFVFSLQYKSMKFFIFVVLFNALNMALLRFMVAAPYFGIKLGVGIIFTQTLMPRDN